MTVIVVDFLYTFSYVRLTASLFDNQFMCLSLSVIHSYGQFVLVTTDILCSSIKIFMPCQCNCSNSVKKNLSLVCNDGTFVTNVTKKLSKKLLLKKH